MLEGFMGARAWAVEGGDSPLDSDIPLCSLSEVVRIILASGGSAPDGATGVRGYAYLEHRHGNAVVEICDLLPGALRYRFGT